MHEDLKEWIPLEQCVDGNVYKIAARNASFGIFNKGGGRKHEGGNDSFTISRRKFTDNFLFEEFHWDTGEPFGTAKPTEDLGKAPTFENDADKLKYLNGLTESEKDNQ